MKGGIRSSDTFASVIKALGPDGKESNAVSISASSAKGDYSVEVKQLAVADLYESRSKVGGRIQSAAGFEFDATKIKNGTSYDFTLDGATRRVSFNNGEVYNFMVDGKSTPGAITFVDGKMSVTYTDMDEGGKPIETPSYTVKDITNDQLEAIFNIKLQQAFGMDGELGPDEKPRQKVEASITAGGGISFSTNGYHTGFSMANGNYSFASIRGLEANFTGQPTIGLNLRSTTGVSKDIKVETIGKTGEQIASDLNTALTEAGFGDKLSAEFSEGRIKFTNFSTAEGVTVTDSAEGVGSLGAMGLGGSFHLEASGGLAELGITSGASSKISQSQTLGDVFGDDLTAQRTFSINGTTFTFAATTKISDLIEGVNKADIGVKMSYDAYSETFKLEASETGAINKIELRGDFLTNNLDFGSTAKRAAADSIAVINGVTMTRASNSYNFEGVDWTFNQVTNGETIKVSSTNDTDKIMETIKSFIEGYNGLIAKMRDQTGTMRPKSQGAYFDPLTDEERKEMSESDIKLWDEKAKTGLLYNDSIIENIETQLRQVLNQSVTLADGSKMSLASIGITTTTDWTKGGELMIRDEAKLRESIETLGDKIGEMFTKTTEEGGKGLAERVNDVLSNAVSAEGPIARKAGVKGTYSETNNEIFRRLTAQNDAIEKLMEQLATKEQNYYNKFAKIEAAMGQAQSQMQYVQSMMG
jgi:flagellar hook-associated protein 2